MTGSRVRGLVALVGLLGVIVGAPVLIDALGGPPPSSIPSLHDTARALSRPVSDGDIIGAVTLVAWALWALFALASAIEVVAHVRGRPGPAQTGRGLRIPLLQAAVGPLVLSALMAIVPRAALAAPNSGGGSAIVQPTPRATPGVSATWTAPDTPIAHTAPDPAVAYPSWPRYVVRRYDSPWQIAERHLGNGLRWRELRDQEGGSLIDGTETVATPAGPEVESTARTIFPGQVLLLPPDATGVEVPAPPPPPPPVVGLHPVPTPSSPRPTVVWTGELAAARHGSGVTPAGAARPTTAPRVEWALGAGLVASAALNLVALRRRRQSQRAAPGTRVPLPTGPLARVETALRTGRRDDRVTAAHRAAAALATDLSRAGRAVPVITGLLVGDDAVEVLLTEPHPPPPPWGATLDGRRWLLSTVDIPVSAGAGGELPTLVPVGTLRGVDVDVLLNLGAPALTSIAGPPEITSGMAHGAAIALTGLPWARSADVVLVGFGEVLAATQPHVRLARSVSELEVELRRSAGSSSAPSRPGGAAEDPPVPTVLVSPTAPSPAEMALLTEVCRPDTAISALVTGDGAPRVLHAGADRLVIPDLDIDVQPISLAEADAAAITQLLGVGLVDQPRDRTEAPYADLVTSAAPGDDAPAVAPGPEPTVVVSVLGAIEIEGLAADFRRPRAKEAAVYLAMHPRGVAEHQFDEAIWPQRHLVKATTRDPVVSSARHALGGPGRLGYAEGQGPDKRYRVGPSVQTDWDHFCRMHATGRRTGDAAALRAALELVRGPPFADVLAGPGYAWLHVEGHLHHMEAEVVDAADLAAEWYLAAGDPVNARWAANQGLRAGPYAERLWVRLMAVADALGEAQDVERLLVELDRRLDLEGDFSQLHPDTIAAYRRYSRRRNPGTTGVVTVTWPGRRHRSR